MGTRVEMNRLFCRCFYPLVSSSVTNDRLDKPPHLHLSNTSRDTTSSPEVAAFHGRAQQQQRDRSGEGQRRCRWRITSDRKRTGSLLSVERIQFPCLSQETFEEESSDRGSAPGSPSPQTLSVHRHLQERTRETSQMS